MLKYFILTIMVKMLVRMTILKTGYQATLVILVFMCSILTTMVSILVRMTN